MFDESSMVEDDRGQLLTVENDIHYYADDTQHNFTAYSNDKAVGTMSLDEDENERFWLDHINVQESWQKRGIGSRLIACAVNIHADDFRVPKSGLLGDRFKYYLSEEGAALINSCLSKKIILDKHVMVPPMNEDHRNYDDCDNPLDFCSDNDDEPEKQDEDDFCYVEYPDNAPEVKEANIVVREKEKEKSWSLSNHPRLFPTITSLEYKRQARFDVVVSNNFGVVEGYQPPIKRAK